MVRAFHPARRRLRLGIVAAVCLLALLVAGCTGRGGGWLPPDQVVFADEATFGFTFSCERSSDSVNPNPPAGRLRIQLEYTDHGANTLALASPDTIHGPFTIHGEADTIDPVLESAICIGENPPPDGATLIFLGRYRPTSSSADQFPQQCRTTTLSSDPPSCRFEVIVRDNDGNRAPSVGDYFSIKLSNSTVPCSVLVGDECQGDPQNPPEEDPSAIIYARAGLLGGGEIQVD